MAEEYTVIQSFSDHGTPVGEPGDTITITVEDGDVVYYGDRDVGPQEHQGILNVGDSLDVTLPPTYIRSASESLIRLVGINNGVPVADLPPIGMSARGLRGDLFPYGLIDSPTLDQTARVQMLFNDAVAQGKDPILPCGTIMTGPVTFDYSATPTIFLGYPAPSIQSTGTGFTTLQQIPGSPGDLLTVRGHTNIGTGHTGKVIGFTLRNLRLVGLANQANPTGTSSTFDAVIVMSVFQYARFDNVYILGAQGDGLAVERQNFTLTGTPTDDYSFHLDWIGGKLFQGAGRAITTRDQTDHTLQAPNAIGECTFVGVEIQHWGLDGIKGPWTSLTWIGGQVNSAGTNAGHAIHLISPPNHGSLGFSVDIRGLHYEFNAGPGRSGIRVDGTTDVKINASMLCTAGEDGYRIGDLQGVLTAAYTVGDSTITIAPPSSGISADPGSGPATEGWVDADHFVFPNGAVYRYTGRTKTQLTGVSWITGGAVADANQSIGAVVLPDAGTRYHRIDMAEISGMIQGKASQSGQMALHLGPMAQYPSIEQLDIWGSTFAATVNQTDPVLQSVQNLIDDRGVHTGRRRGNRWSLNPVGYEAMAPTTEYAFESQAIGEGFVRYHVRADGYQSVGPGTSAPDVNLSRAGVQKYQMDAVNGVFATGPLYMQTVVADGSTPGIFCGTGVPAFAAPVGSSYYRKDGGTGSTLYVKESGTGSSGWVAK